MPVTRRDVLTAASSLPFLGAAPASGTWSKNLEVEGAIDGRAGKGALLVRTPPGYSAEKKHPLIIALHGWDHSPELWNKKNDLGPLADKLGCVLAVPAMGRTIYETRFYPESKSSWTTAPGTRWVGEVVLPYLRKSYAVDAARAQTAVIGYSTGGRGAVLLAEAYPEFAFAASLSGTFDLMRLSPGDGEYKIHAAIYGQRDAFPDRWKLDNCVAPDRLAALAGTRLFIGHGADDKVVKPDQLDALEEALRGGPVKADFVKVPGAGHDWKFWSSQWSRVFDLAAQTFGA